MSKKMKLTAQDYRNAIEVVAEWDIVYTNPEGPSFNTFCKAKIKELEKPEPPLYKCIQVPPYSEKFELGKLYHDYFLCGWFSLSDLPFHFELVVPEPEKITWDEVSNLIESFKRQTFLPQGFYIELKKIIDRIKKDHLS